MSQYQCSGQKLAAASRHRVTNRVTIDGVSGRQWLDMRGRKLDALLPAQQLQEQRNAIARGLAGIKPDVIAKGTLHDPHGVAPPRLWLRWQLDVTAALAATDIIDDTIGNAGRAAAGKDKATDARRILRIRPLQRDQHENVAGKQRRDFSDPLLPDHARLAHLRVINLKACEVPGSARRR